MSVRTHFLKPPERLDIWIVNMYHGIGGVKVSLLASSVVDHGCSSPGQVKQKTMRLVFVVSPLCTQYSDVSTA
jgi:hypothetical protein